MTALTGEYLPPETERLLELAGGLDRDGLLDLFRSVVRDRAGLEKRYLDLIRQWGDVAKAGAF